MIARLCHVVSSHFLILILEVLFAHVAATKTLHDPPECQTFWNRCVSRCHLTSPNDTCETIDETSRSAFRIFSGSFSGQELDPFGQVHGSSESTSQHLHCVGSPPRRFFDDCRPVLPCISNLSTEYVRWNCLESLEHHKRLISSEKSWKNRHRTTQCEEYSSTVCLLHAILLYCFMPKGKVRKKLLDFEAPLPRHTENEIRICPRGISSFNIKRCGHGVEDCGATVLMFRA